MEPSCSNSTSVHHSHFRGKETEAQRGRVTLVHSCTGRSGRVEIQTWATGSGILAFNFCTGLSHGAIIATLPLPLSSQHRARQDHGCPGLFAAQLDSILLGAKSVSSPPGCPRQCPSQEVIVFVGLSAWRTFWKGALVPMCRARAG